jgi:hypothetical protein
VVIVFFVSTDLLYLFLYFELWAQTGCLRFSFFSFFLFFMKPASFGFISFDSKQQVLADASLHKFYNFFCAASLKLAERTRLPGLGAGLFEKIRTPPAPRGDFLPEGTPLPEGNEAPALQINRLSGFKQAR